MVLPTQELATTSISAKPGATMPAATACGQCGVDGRRLLHHVRDRGIFRRLCTSCVLRLHTQFFCPTCFAVYHPSPPPSGADAVTCLKCYSSSHSHCVGPNPPTPYVCPICVNPSSPIFTLKEAKSNDVKFSDNRDVNCVNNENCRAIDAKTAKILLAAARISSVSMSKAAMAARADAERKAKEAAVTRKRARESLEHVLYLTAKEKMKKNQALIASSAVNVGVLNNRVANSSTGAVVLGGALAERPRVGNVERMDSSNEVLAALNAVELREQEKSGVLKLQNVVSGQSSNNGVAMDVKISRGTAIALSSKIVSPGIENHGGASITTGLGELGQLENQNALREKASNGVVPVVPSREVLQEKASNGVVQVPSRVDQMQVVEYSHAKEEDSNMPQQ